MYPAFLGAAFAATILAMVYGIVIYNALVTLRHAVAQSWANIEVLLKQRHDELPKLVEVCRQYKQFESTTLEAITAARSQIAAARERGDVGTVGLGEGMLRGALANIFAVAEAYPELRANEHFMQLQTRISDLEEAIADRREVYNSATTLYNTRIDQFPDLIVARMAEFAPKVLLSFEASDLRDVRLRDLFP